MNAPASTDAGSVDAAMSAPAVDTSARGTGSGDNTDSTTGLSNVQRREVPELAPQTGTSSPTDLNLDVGKATPTPSDANPSSRERPGNDTGMTPEQRNPSDVRDVGAQDNPY
jgi:hypothetical protein